MKNSGIHPARSEEDHLSDALTPDAHGDESAATSVEDTAPASEPSVESGSAGDRTVPVERFNGLMASHQRTLDEMRTLRDQVTALQAERTKQETKNDVSDDTTRDEVAALRAELAQERLDRARREVLDEFPDAKPFGDLIVANTVEEMRDLARVLAERVQAVKGAETPTPAADTTDATGTETPAGASAETPAASATPETPAVPEAGGAATFDGGAALDEAVTDAIGKGDFRSYLAARVAQVKATGADMELA